MNVLATMNGNNNVLNCFVDIADCKSQFTQHKYQTASRKSQTASRNSQIANDNAQTFLNTTTTRLTVGDVRRLAAAGKQEANISRSKRAKDAMSMAPFGTSNSADVPTKLGPAAPLQDARRQRLGGTTRSASCSLTHRR